MTIVLGKEEFEKRYQTNKNNFRRNTWVLCVLNDGRWAYVSQDEDFRNIKKFCIDNKVFIEQLSLKYKSHVVKFDTEGGDGVYIVKSVKGAINAETVDCIVLGKIDGDKVYKKAFKSPELVEMYSDTDCVDNCFLEALIYNEKRQGKTI
jgi:hypothetical protein